MKTINQVIRVTGTAAERALLVDKDVDDSTIIEFSETDTGDKYEWDGDSWVQTGTNGAALVTTPALTEYTTTQRLDILVANLDPGRTTVWDTTLNKAMVYIGDGTTNVAADWRYEQQVSSIGAAYVAVGSAGGSAATTTLLSAVTATGAGTGVSMPSGRCTFQATLTGTTANSDLAATVLVQVSNDNSHWETLGTIVLAVTDWDSSAEDDSDGFSSDAPWAYVRGNVTAISDTGGVATVSLMMGV